MRRENPQKELSMLIESAEELLFERTFLSLSLLKEKIKSFVKQFGFIEDPYFLQILAAYSIYSGKYETGKIFLDKSLDSKYSEEDDLLFNGGLLYKEAGDFEKSENTANKCIELYPQNIHCKRLLLEIYFIKKDKKMIDRIFDEIIKDSFILTEYLVLAGIAYGNGNMDFSVKCVHYVFSQMVIFFGYKKGFSKEDAFYEAVKRLLVFSGSISSDTEKAIRYFLRNNGKLNCRLEKDNVPDLN